MSKISKRYTHVSLCRLLGAPIGFKVELRYDIFYGRGNMAMVGQ